MRAHAPPDLGVLADRARVDQEADELRVLDPSREKLSGMPQRGKNLVKISVRVECRCVWRPSSQGELPEQREQLGQHRAKRAVDGDRAVGAVDADVHVQAERVVAPGHVAQRRLDDRGSAACRSPAGPASASTGACRPRTGGSRASSATSSRSTRRRAIAAAASAKLSHLPVLTSTSLRISSPATIPRSVGCSAGGHVEPLEAGRHLQRGRFEDRELLLDRDGEVLGLLELDARRARAPPAGR